MIDPAVLVPVPAVDVVETDPMLDVSVRMSAMRGSGRVLVIEGERDVGVTTAAGAAALPLNAAWYTASDLHTEPEVRALLRQALCETSEPMVPRIERRELRAAAGYRDLMVVDNSHLLTAPARRWLRDLLAVARSRLGLVLLGPSGCHEVHVEHGSFAGRLAKPLVMAPLTGRQVRFFAEAVGLPTEALDRHTWKIARQACSGLPGQWVTIARTARTLSADLGRDSIDADVVRLAVAQL